MITLTTEGAEVAETDFRSATRTGGDRKAGSPLENPKLPTSAPRTDFNATRQVGEAASALLEASIDADL